MQSPLQRAINDATRTIDNMYRYLSKKSAEPRDYYALEIETRGESFARTIPFVEGNKTYVRKICGIGTIMPSAFLLSVITDFRTHYQDKKPEMYRFIAEQAQRINECRALYMKMYVIDNHITPEQIRTRTNDAIIDIADQYKEPRLTPSDFVMIVSKKLIRLPQIMSFSDMYDLYLEKSGHRTVKLDIAENFLDYTEPESAAHPLGRAAETNAHRKNDRHALDIRYYQQKYANVSPWKTASKIADYAHKNRWSGERLSRAIENKAADSFDMKKQRKLMKHYVSGRYGFVFDYMLSGVYRYLLAININTRKAFFAIPKEIVCMGHNWSCRKKGEWMPTGESAIDSVKHLLDLTPIKSVIMDNESAFIDANFQRFLTDSGIRYHYVRKYNVDGVMDMLPDNKSRSTHSTSLIDRLIRTLRLMNYNLGNPKEISPPMLNYLIDEYNNSVHSTLSKIIGRDVTPNMVDANVMLETAIVKHLRQQNFLMENNPAYAVSKTVRVYNDIPKRDMEKVKPKLLPGKWEYVGREYGLFKLQQNGNVIMVPRWMIKNE